MVSHPFRLAKPIVRSGRPVNELREKESSNLSRQREASPDTWARGTGLDVTSLRPCTSVLAGNGEAGRGRPSQSQTPDDQFHLGDIGEVVRYSCEVHLGGEQVRSGQLSAGRQYLYLAAAKQCFPACPGAFLCNTHWGATDITQLTEVFLNCDEV